MKRTAIAVFQTVCAGLILCSVLAECRAEDYSHVRIVRLSFVEGTVTLQRPDVPEWAEALVNTPIQEGFQIATAEGGYTEVEFENASTARLGQLSLIEFTQLALLPRGGKVNRLTLYQGYATFSVVPEGEDFYEVKAGMATLTPRGESRFRVDLDQGFLQVKVFKGTVELQSAEGNGTLGGNTVVVIRPGEGQRLVLSQGITKDAWDEWVEQREAVARLARLRGAPTATSAGLSDFIFGFLDLLFYGQWYSYPDYGYVWMPVADPGWNPYSVGRWCWYPEFGWVWISAEPWGWMPYHYGAWIYVSGLGWVWSPRNLGAWSPALVNWCRGPGWIGWAPRSPGQSAVPGWNVASEDDFRLGKLVRPGNPGRFDLLLGGPVDRPDIQPERAGRLPGVPRLTPEFRPAVGKDLWGRIPTGVPTSGNEVRSTVPAPPLTPRSNRPAEPTNHAVRPGPRENYPAPAPPEALRDRNAPDERFGRPEQGSLKDVQKRSGGGESSSSRDDETPSYDSRGSSGRSSNTSSATSSRSTPAADHRTDSGSRSFDSGSHSSGRESSSSNSGRSSSRDSSAGSSSSSSSSSSRSSSPSHDSHSSSTSDRSSSSSSHSSSSSDRSSSSSHDSGSHPHH